MPLLAPGATIHSKRRSKSLKVSMVMMSPLSAAGCPPLAACFNRPASTDQPLAGKPAFLKPRHPFVVAPSNSSFHPAARSADVRRRLLGGVDRCDGRSIERPH